MAMLPFREMTEAQAAAFRDETRGDVAALDPVPAYSGPQAAQRLYYLPERVLFDPAHADRRDALRMCKPVVIDSEILKPPPEPE
jgi:hypothetical protein